MAAIEAILQITRWGKNLASCAYSTVIILPIPNTDEHSASCTSRSPRFTNRTNGPQLDTKLVPLGTLPDDRESCFRSNLRKEQAAMLERLLSDEPVPKFAQRTRRILIHEKRESRPNLKDFEQMYRNDYSPSVPPDDTHFCGRPPHHFRIHVSKTGHAKLRAAPALLAGTKETEVCRRRTKAFDWSCPDCGWRVCASCDPHLHWRSVPLLFEIWVSCCLETLVLRCYILARQLVLCAWHVFAMSSRNNRTDQLDSSRKNRALQPTSTPSVPLAVIQPNQRCLFVQLSVAWNE